MADMSQQLTQRFAADCRECGKRLTIRVPSENAPGKHVRCGNCGITNWCEVSND